MRARVLTTALVALLLNGCARSALRLAAGETPEAGKADASGGSPPGSADSDGSASGAAAPVGPMDAGPPDVCELVLVEGRCVEAADCQPGEYVQTEATATSDRVCAPCEVGTYSTIKNAAECTAATPCTDTEYETAAPTSTADRTCAELECLEGATGVIAEDVEVATQEGMSALAGVHEVTGDLWIHGTTTTTPITSLDSLRCLRSVGGRLRIDGAGIPTLRGLERVASVGEGRYGAGLVITSNNALRNLQGLDALATVEGHLQIYYNEALEDLTGLENLESIGGNIWIDDNPALASLGEFDSLETTPGGVYSGLFVFNNPKLSKCRAAEFARSIGRTCTRPGSREVTCTEVCTCTGNLNDVTCPE